VSLTRSRLQPSIYHLASADDRFGRFVASDRDVSRKEMWEALVSRSSGHAKALWMYPPCWTRRDVHNGTQEAEPPLLGELRNALTPDDTGRREDAVLSFPEDERTFCIFVAWLYSRRLTPPSSGKVFPHVEALLCEPARTMSKKAPLTRRATLRWARSSGRLTTPQTLPNEDHPKR